MALQVFPTDSLHGKRVAEVAVVVGAAMDRSNRVASSFTYFFSAFGRFSNIACYDVGKGDACTSGA